MKKFLKISAIVLAVLLAALIVAPMLFKGKIIEIVKKEANDMLNAKFDFEKLDISLLRHFPRASIDLKGLTIINEAPFEGDTLVSAQRISVVVNLMSLFSSDGYEVTKLVLAQPSVFAQKNVQGKVSWDIMKPSDAATETEDSAPSSFRLSIRDFRIDNASIRYRDDSTKMNFATYPLSLRLRGDMTADKTNLNFEALAKGMKFVSEGTTLLNSAEVEVKAAVAAELAENRYTFSQAHIRLNAIELGLDGWVQLKESGAIAMDLTAATEKVQFKDILSLVPALYTQDFKNLTASGELTMSLWAKGEMIGAKLPAFEVKADVANGTFKYASLPKSVDNINIAARIANPGSVMDKTEVDISKFTLRMAGNSLAASLYATNIISDPLFRAAVDGKVDLGAIREVYPLDKSIDLRGIITANIKASGRMSDVEKQRYEQLAASGSFVVENMGVAMPNLPPVEINRMAATITPSTMTLGEANIKVGRSDFAANGQIRGYLGYFLRDEVLSGRLYVKSNLLDLNELLGIIPSSDEPQTPDEPMEAILVPKNLNLSLGTDLQQVLFHKMTISAISGEMHMANQAVTLDRLSLQLFGGKGTASGSYSTVNPKHPAMKIALGLSGASFVRTFNELEMVQKMVPIFEKTGGDYSLALDMTAALDAKMQPDLHSVNATGEIKSANIHIQNIEVFDMIAKALNSDQLNKIEAKDVAIRFTIKNGRLSTQPFDLKLGNVKLNLSGSTGLDQTIDYTAKVSLPSGTTGGILQNVSVGIGGTFSSPKISVGLKEAAQEAVKNVVDQQIQKLTGSESLGDEIQKQADNLRAQAKVAGEKLVAAAQAQSDKLVEEAGSKGALAKVAAQAAGKKLVSEAQKQADKLTAEAEAQITKLQSNAKL